mmetsp:Transcript_121528/g.227130  ORF Transcript_121528/g.227130 Transcript_121528/m.227130 type:complete len:225 (-) Transcript_121528:109-783(-)
MKPVAAHFFAQLVHKPCQGPCAWCPSERPSVRSLIKLPKTNHAEILWAAFWGWSRHRSIIALHRIGERWLFWAFVTMPTAATKASMMLNVDGNLLNPAAGGFTHFTTSILDRIMQRAGRAFPPLSPIPFKEEGLQLAQYGQDAVGTAPTTVRATFLFLGCPLASFQHVQAYESGEDVRMLHGAAKNFYLRRTVWIFIREGELKVQNHRRPTAWRLPSNIAMPRE